MKNPKLTVKAKVLIGIMLLAFLVMGMSVVEDHSVIPKTFDKNYQEGVDQIEKRIAIDVGLVVNDMDSSLAFYRDMLGLEQLAEIKTKLIGNGLMVQLKHGASLIKLLKMDKSSTTKKDGFVNVQGYRYITLMVEEIDFFNEKMKNNNIEIVLPLTELGNGANILMAKDPDGNVVEFVQEAP